MQAKKQVCIDEIIDLLDEIRNLSNKNVQSLKSLKKFNLPNLDLKVAAIQTKSTRFLSLTVADLKKLPLPKLEKVRSKCVRHIDKLLNQDLSLKQLASKCTFLQENSCAIREEEDDEGQDLDRSDTLTALMRSNANLSHLTIPESEDDDGSSGQEKSDEGLDEDDRRNGKNARILPPFSPRQREESPKVSKRDYDSLFNEHMKALETIKELKRRIVQKTEEENLARLSNKRPETGQKEKGIMKKTSLFLTKNQANPPTKIAENRRFRNSSQHYNSSAHVQTESNISPKAIEANQGKNEKNGNYDYTNKQLMSYIFQLQNKYLEEVQQKERMRTMCALEIEKQEKLIKNLMKEKTENDTYKSYSSISHYLDFMEPQEIIDLIKNAKEYKQFKSLQRSLDDLKRSSSEKIDRLTKEKEALIEELTSLKGEMENTRNESVLFMHTQESDRSKLLSLEKEKIEIERNLLEIERNKLKTEKEEILRYRELAKISENRVSMRK